MIENQEIKKIVVVGRDADAWLSALALQVAFAKKSPNVEVHLVELPSLLTPSDHYITLPTQAALHQVLGIDETKLLRSCGGSQFLGQRFSGWGEQGSSYVHAYDTCGTNINNVEFLHYWLKAKSSGLNVPFEDFSMAVAAAKQGKLFVYNDAVQSYSNATQGFHLNALSYLRVMGSAALQAGVIHYPVQVDNVEVKEGEIKSVLLNDGRKVEGDLFIDASGTQSILIDKLDQSNFNSWQQWLPCDHVLSASAPAMKPIPAFSQITAFEAGWIGLYPLVSHTAVVAGYSSKYAEPNDVLKRIFEFTSVNPVEPIVTKINPGARPKQWLGNCVALGTSAVNLDPLDATSLLMLHNGISHLISLFPVSKQWMPESDLFNRKMMSRAENVRDFQISHFKLNKRAGQSMWDSVRDVDAPVSLRDKLSLFSAQGIIAMREEETFQEENWTSVLIGQGLMPKSYDPLVDRMPEQDQILHFQKILSFIAKEVEDMPTLQAHIELNNTSFTSESSF